MKRRRISRKWEKLLRKTYFANTQLLRIILNYFTQFLRKPLAQIVFYGIIPAEVMQMTLAVLLLHNCFLCLYLFLVSRILKCPFSFPYNLLTEIIPYFFGEYQHFFIGDFLHFYYTTYSHVFSPLNLVNDRCNHAFVLPQFSPTYRKEREIGENTE